MFANILEKIESLPPLPQTIIDVEEFRKKENKEIDELIKIIEKDALIITTLLKISNSSLFGFKSKVESISRVVNLLGINFIVYVTISEKMNDILTTDLSSYGISTDDFMNASTASSNLVNLWLSKVDNKLKDEILLASILQEIGKFILSELIISKGLKEVFIQKIQEGIEIPVIEKEFLGITTSQVTAEIFRYWKLDEELISCIEFVDTLEKCKEEYKQKAQILDVIKTACNPCCFLSEVSIEKAINKATAYNLNVPVLKDSIQTLIFRKQSE